MKNKVKIFFLTLKDEEKRTLHMINELKKFNLKYEIVYGKKGKDLTKNDLRLYSKKEAFKSENRDLSLDEIAACLSHISIYKKIVNLKFKYFLIFEDDVVINKDLIKILNRIEKFPKDWGIINFFTDSKQIKTNLIIYKNYRITKFIENANRACALLMKKKTVMKLLEKAFPVRQPPDELTARCNITGIKAYGIQPNLIRLKDFPSTILYRNTFFGKYKSLSWLLKTDLIFFLSFLVIFLKKFLIIIHLKKK
jgi:glycosyl transferase family 25